MTIELETINKLFLELSQFATAKTARELALEKELEDLRHYKRFSDAEASCIEWRDAYAKLAKGASSFFGWFNRHYPFPSNHHDHSWNQLGLALIEAEKIVEDFRNHKP